jgi:hypothetical protein
MQNDQVSCGEARCGDFNPLCWIVLAAVEAAAPFFSVEPIQAPTHEAGAIEENDRSVCTRAEWWSPAQSP